MKVQNDAYVALEYSLTLDSGEVVDQSEPDEPLGFIVGAGMIVPGLENKLQGLEVGAAADIVVEAEDGYGPRDPELLHQVPRDNFPPDAEIETGMMFAAQGPFGVRPVKVDSIAGDKVTIDFNHPLAGERLHFKVKVTEVREATDDDRQAMHHGCEHESCSGCGEHGLH